jgi:hypothetical protein
MRVHTHTDTTRRTTSPIESCLLFSAAQSDACSSVDAARDPICSMNTTHPVCSLLSHAWEFTCRSATCTCRVHVVRRTEMATIDVFHDVVVHFSSQTNHERLANVYERSAANDTNTPSGFHTWQTGLVGGSSTLPIDLSNARTVAIESCSLVLPRYADGVIDYLSHRLLLSSTYTHETLDSVAHQSCR